MNFEHLPRVVNVTPSEKNNDMYCTCRHQRLDVNGLTIFEVMYI